MEDRGLTLKGEITMMKAMKNFMDKPITYGGYAKMCIGAFAISVAYVAYIYHKLGLSVMAVPSHFSAKSNSIFFLTVGLV